jgi:putative acyl-CoA dehydrogenase
VEFRGARARLVGEEGRGVSAIIRMVNHTRLDCMLGSTTSMRRGVVEAIHHARHRHAFGAALAQQPAMQNVLADLALESEAATVAALRIARAYDEGDAARAFRRLATAVMKYWICKRAPVHAAEALECLGGNGFVEDSGMPALYRGAPINSIWEGSGNVAALDVLRALSREPEAVAAFREECELGRGADRHLDAHLDRLAAASAVDLTEYGARRTVEDMALALQGSLLVRQAPPAVADAFCASRLGGQAGRAYGTLGAGAGVCTIIDRALPPR